MVGLLLCGAVLLMITYQTKAFPFVSQSFDFLSSHKDPGRDSVSKKVTASTPSSSAASHKQIRFAVLGDTQDFKASGKSDFSKAVERIDEAKVDFVMTVGDLVDQCDSEKVCQNNFEDWKQIAKPILSKTYVVMGNHDRNGSISDKVWEQAFNTPQNGPRGFMGTVYSFDVGMLHMIVLNTQKPTENMINHDQRTWLEQDLNMHAEQISFVVLHSPAFPVSMQTSEGLDAHVVDRDALWQILDHHNVPATFSGHEHFLARRLIDQRVFPNATRTIQQYIIGSSDVADHDKPEKEKAQFSFSHDGYAIVTVGEQKATVELYAMDGHLLDSSVVSLLHGKG